MKSLHIKYNGQGQGTQKWNSVNDKKALAFEDLCGPSRCFGFWR